MKRFFAILILLSLLALQACSSYSYKPVWYETSELMQSELPFSMINVQSPDIVRAVAYGVLDGKLGEIRYAVEVGGEGGRTAVLRVRKAETGYAENEGFIEAGGMTDGRRYDARFVRASRLRRGIVFRRRELRRGVVYA